MSLGQLFSSLFQTPAQPVQAAAAPTPANLPQPYAASALDHLTAVLQAVAPHLTAAALAEWASAFSPWLRHYSIDTAETLAMFTGQVAVESQGLAVLAENLRFTSAVRICAVWPRRFPNVESAAPYVNEPEKLANLVYAGRMGNTLANDGWRFRGSGPIQLTGRYMYTQLGMSCGKDADEAAAYMLTTAGAAHSACWFWDYKHLNEPAQRWDIEAVTKAINGGLTDLSARMDKCDAALKAARGLHLS